MIQQVQDGRDLPDWRDLLYGSYDERQVLFREMKAVFPHIIAVRGYGITYDVPETDVWYYRRMREQGYTSLSAWFFDSLDLVNKILWGEEEDAIPCVVTPRRYSPHAWCSARNLVAVYGACYQYADGRYTYRLFADFWKDRERETLDRWYTLTEMVTNGWWPSIVREFFLL